MEDRLASTRAFNQALVPDYLLGMIRVEMCREYGPSDVLCNSLQVIPEGGP